MSASSEALDMGPTSEHALHELLRELSVQLPAALQPYTESHFFIRRKPSEEGQGDDGGDLNDNKINVRHLNVWLRLNYAERASVVRLLNRNNNVRGAFAAIRGFYMAQSVNEGYEIVSRVHYTPHPQATTRLVKSVAESVVHGGGWSTLANDPDYIEFGEPHLSAAQRFNNYTRCH